MFKNLRVIILILCILLAIVAIRPNPTKEGVAIRTIISNSSAHLAGLVSPKPNLPPMSREVITFINNKQIQDVEDFEEATKELRLNTSIQVKTNLHNYRLLTKEAFLVEPLNETEIIEVEEIREINTTINGTNTTINKSFVVEKEVQKVKRTPLGVEDLGIRVYDAPTSNIRKGLDLAGGTRVLLEPEKKIGKIELDNLISVMKQRLNIYGLSDIVLTEASDLSGSQFILAEVAGASTEEVKDLIAKQGKFEAKIGEASVFKGGQDITYVCRSPDCAGLDPNRACQASGDGWFCSFRFSIVLSLEAAQRQADATSLLDVITENRAQYLSQPLTLFLDDKQVDQLNIGSELKGSAETNIQISGSGTGRTHQEAAINTLQNMKRLQTILITGSLPYKLEIVKTDTISPLLGEEFLQNALFIGLLAILTVGVCIFVRYRSLKIAIPLLITSLSELVILLGIAALIGWNIDLAAIAGIIIAIGTGVDHQILITDETLKGDIRKIFNWKERIKGAFYIIMGAYLTTVFAMIPLVFAGAGLVKGFAIITIIGVSVGVFITRPAYAKIIEILLKE